MSRKHYVVIAAALASTLPNVEQFTTYSAVGNNSMVNHISYDAALDQWKTDRDAVARVLSDSAGYDLNGNRRFDRERFIAATER